MSGERVGHTGPPGDAGPERGDRKFIAHGFENNFYTQVYAHFDLSLMT